MKKIFLLLSIILLVSCSSDDDSNIDTNDDNPIVNQYEDDIASIAGNFYVISQLTVSGENKTMEFSDYTFNYKADGSLVARVNLLNASGVYNYIGKTSQESNELLDISFVNANPSEPFMDLNERWTIESATVDQVSLRFSNGVDINKMLVFTKS